MYLLCGVTWFGKSIKSLGVASVSLLNIVLILYQVWLYLSLRLVLSPSKHIW